MRALISTVCFVTVLILSLAACEQSPQIVEPPTVTTLSDNRLDGNVILLDSHGNPVTDRSGVEVIATNTGGTSYYDTTDAVGIYHLEDLPAGVYTIVASHGDYDSLAGTSVSKYNNLQYVGTGVYNVNKLTLAQLPDQTIVSDISVNVEWTFTPDSHDPSIIEDTTGKVLVSMDWENIDLSITPRFYVTTNATDDCSSAIFEIKSAALVSRTGTQMSYHLGNVFSRLQEMYGDDVYSQTFYLQIRPKTLVRSTADSEPFETCGTPVTSALRFDLP